MCLRLVFVEVSRTRSLDGCCRGHAEGHDRCAQNLSPDIPRLHPQTLSISGCPKVEVQMGKGWKAVPGTKVGASISGVPIAAAVTRHPPDRWQQWQRRLQQPLRRQEGQDATAESSSCRMHRQASAQDVWHQLFE